MVDKEGGSPKEPFTQEDAVSEENFLRRTTQGTEEINLEYGELGYFSVILALRTLLPPASFQRHDIKTKRDCGLTKPSKTIKIGQWYTN